MRAIYDDPPDMRAEGERFKRFRVLNERGLPVSVANPMARNHVPEAIDALLAIDAESLARSACAEVVHELDDPDICIGFVVADPLGQWTDRILSDAEHRFARIQPNDWAVVLWWADQPVDEVSVLTAVIAEVVRASYRLRHGLPVDLADVLRREGHALTRAGVDPPTIDGELDDAAAIIETQLAATGFGTWVAAMYGDAGARAGGWIPLGLPDRAGEAVAIARHLRSATSGHPR